MIKKKNALKFCCLHALFLLFSCIPILSKLAGQEPVFSAKFFLYLGGVFVLLGIYAVLWQKILKLFPLIVAFSNKAITIAWGILFGRFIFDEEITIGMICGAAIIIAGIVIISLNQTQKKNDKENAPLQAVSTENEGNAPVQAVSMNEGDEKVPLQAVTTENEENTPLGASSMNEGDGNTLLQAVSMNESEENNDPVQASSMPENGKGDDA